MSPVTGTLFEGMILADQTALVRRLLSQSKDIGVDKVFNEEQHDQAYRFMTRYRFRWFMLSGTELSEMKASANFRRQATLNATNCEKKAARMQRLVDDLDMAELVGSEVIDPERWLLVVGDSRTRIFRLSLGLAKVPLIETEYGVWMADDKVLANNFIEAERILQTPEFIRQCRM